MHAVVGDIMYAREFVSNLETDLPVYGMLPVPLDGTQRVPRAMPDVADNYIAEIRKVRSEGPYLLAGYSFGGFVAMEIAQRLLAQGERVDFLGMIDTNYGTLVDVPNEKTAVRIKRHLHNVWLHNPLTYLNRRIRVTIDDYVARLAESALQLANSIRSRLCFAIPYKERERFYRHIFTSVSRGYRPRPYAGEITLFTREGTKEWHEKRWRPLALGELHTHELPGGHYEIIRSPHSFTLAKYFDDCLHRLQT